MPKRNLIRRHDYHDSVQLMLAAGALRKRPGVRQAILMMGTPSNKRFLQDLGLLLAEGEAATADDLILALEADSVEALGPALQDLEALLRGRPGAPRAARRPRTLEEAVRQLPGVNLCLISVPGRYAAAEARRALCAGLHVLLFSDNVPLEQERELKGLARTQGLFCLGPDCGVVNLNGVALALASVVRRGPVGLAGASGSGIQQVAALVEREGLGVSQAIGVGGRDLHDAVGALGLEMALDALEADPETRIVVVVSRVPGTATLPRVLARLAACHKPVVAFLSGVEPAALHAIGVHPARDLEDAAALAVALVTGGPAERRTDAGEAEGRTLLRRETHGLLPTQRFVRGLFCGGTFLEEALRILSPALGPIRSNASLAPDLQVAGRDASRGHTLIDFGAEEFTLGRPHPVIDPELRRDRLLQEAQDPEVAVVLLDFILGPAVHPDPAGAMAEAIAEAKRRAAAEGRSLSVVASVCGTEGDPQRLSIQEETLRRVGVAVVPSNARAARLAAAIAERAPYPPLAAADLHPDLAAAGGVDRAARPAGEGPSPIGLALFGQELRVVNVGLALFAEALERQSVPSVSVDWRPPAGGDEELVALLEKLGGL